MLPAAVGATPEPGYSAAVASSDPVLPDYGGACLSSLVPALLSRHAAVEPWLPAPVGDARQVLLLVLDGLGWEKLQACAASAPALHSGAGGPITSVVPTTTATALTCITTGLTPAGHGVVGYRMAVEGGRGGRRQVLNVLQWTTGAADARQSFPATAVQPHPPFGGRRVPTVTRSDSRPST
jgi:Type I phosphodiesterase / nucleotide pyrophosphatase